MVTSNPTQGAVYSMQHYAIKTASDFRQVGGFPISSNKTEIVLKVALNAITLNLTHNNVPLPLYNQWMYSTKAYILPCPVNLYMTQGHPPVFIQLMDL